jgi:hypothetical protein
LYFLPGLASDLNPPTSSSPVAGISDMYTTMLSSEDFHDSFVCFIFASTRGLNSGPHAYKAGGLTTWATPPAFMILETK